MSKFEKGDLVYGIDDSEIDKEYGLGLITYKDDKMYQVFWITISKSSNDVFNHHILDTGHYIITSIFRGEI